LTRERFVRKGPPISERERIRKCGSATGVQAQHVGARTRAEWSWAVVDESGEVGQI
jgi:hypothetical protein